MKEGGVNNPALNKFAVLILVLLLASGRMEVLVCLCSDVLPESAKFFLVLDANFFRTIRLSRLVFVSTCRSHCRLSLLLPQPGVIFAAQMFCCTFYNKLFNINIYMYMFIYKYKYKLEGGSINPNFSIQIYFSIKF